MTLARGLKWPDSQRCWRLTARARLLEDGTASFSPSLCRFGPSVLCWNIRAVDRMIWSAIGNTTTLAARLQSLTRVLGASMLIDEATWRAAGTASEDFELRDGVAIHGREQREDVYLLPLR